MLGKIAQLPVNFAEGIGERALGVPAGIEHLTRLEIEAILKSGGDPTKILAGFLKPVAEETAKSYADYYGKDVLHNIYEDPAQVVLDALTVASLGAGAGVKAGVVSGERVPLVTRSPRAAITGEGPVRADISSTSPLVRAVETAKANVRQRNPEGIGVGKVRIGGEQKAYGKAVSDEAQRAALGRLQPMDAYSRATRGLKAREQEALNIRADAVHPEDLVDFYPPGSKNALALQDPRIVNLVLNPSRRMRRAEPAMPEISAAMRDLFVQQGRLDPEAASARETLVRDTVSESLGRPARPIPGGPEPYYVPHKLLPPQPAAPLTSSGGGRGVPQRIGSERRNQQVLLEQGRREMGTDLLGGEMLQRVKRLKYEDIHNGLLNGGLEVTPQQYVHQYGRQLPKGWGFVLKRPTRVTETVSAEPNPNQMLLPGMGGATQEVTRTLPGSKVPPSWRAEGERSIEDVVGSQEPTGPSLEQGFTTDDINLAHVNENGTYTIVPERMAKRATGEFAKTNKVITNSLKAWRAIVLGLRPGFFTNNLVGNAMMYASRTAGAGAVRDLKSVLSASPEMRQLFSDLYAEQGMRANFGMTQSPATSPAARAGSASLQAGRTITGALPRFTSRVAEQLPREALVRHYVRKSPEFRAVWRELPRDTRTFEQAFERVHEGEAGEAFQRLISKKVDHSLGNYTHLSPFERNVMRNTLPFYAWYRALVTTTAHLVLEAPLRANILANIGQIGWDVYSDLYAELPSFLKGAIPLGQGPNNTERVLSTQGANPYATIPQLWRGATKDVTDAGLNPFIQAIANYVARSGDQNPPYAILGQSLLDIGRNLPPVRVAFPHAPSDLYPNRGRESEFFTYMGVPIKEYNPREAKHQAKEGR